ncbi:MAG: FAD:protein transferase [Gaiellales bacterium]|jgi:thiamine biosynthesis lipoprotein|nr:FAD:protein transferase [Gaiellales bacterium]
MIGHTERVMGTVASFTVEPGERGEGHARDAIGSACRVLHEADAVFSTFKPDSPLSRLRRGEAPADDLPPEVLEVLERSARATRLTQGAFDPWAMPGGVDPTGLVKGWAAQRALAELRQAGVEAAMVNAGGDIACFGPQPWRIGVRDPNSADRLVCVAEVSAAIATSGGYERPDEIVDPRRGRPAAALVQATVIGDDLALADAFATALMVTGEDGLTLLTGEPGYSALIVTADGRMLATPEFPIAA